MIFTAFKIVASTLFIEEAGLLLNLAFLSKGEITLSWSIVLNTLGILSADICLFFFGLLLFSMNKPNSRFCNRFDKIVSILETARIDLKKIPYSIIASRIIPGLRYPTHVSAGYLRYSFSNFFVRDLLSVATWSSVVIVMGSKVLHFIDPNFIIGIIIMIFAFKVARYFKHLYEKKKI